MRFLLLLSFLVLFGCSDEHTEYYIQPELKPYVEAFYSEADTRGIFVDRDALVVILTKDLVKSKGAAGLTTYVVGERQAKVEIDEEYFYENDSICVEWTIYHELGHAIFKMDHTSSWSIMNPQMRCYKGDFEYKQFLLDLLFNGQ